MLIAPIALAAVSASVAAGDVMNDVIIGYRRQQPITALDHRQTDTHLSNEKNIFAVYYVHLIEIITVPFYKELCGHVLKLTAVAR